MAAAGTEARVGEAERDPRPVSRRAPEARAVIQAARTATLQDPAAVTWLHSAPAPERLCREPALGPAPASPPGGAAGQSRGGRASLWRRLPESGSAAWRLRAPRCYERGEEPPVEVWGAASA